MLVFSYPQLVAFNYRLISTTCNYRQGFSKALIALSDALCGLFENRKPVPFIRKAGTVHS